MALCIEGIGSAVPAYSLPQSLMADVASRLCCSSPREERLLRALYDRSRIESRGSVLLDETAGEARHTFYPIPRGASDRGPRTSRRMEKYEKYALPLTLLACRKALDQARLLPDQITHLLTVSCTGFYAPGLDCELIEELGLPRSTERVQIGFMGCHAALNALRAASAIAASQPDAQILLASTELCSLHLSYGWDADRILANALFADGAGAIAGSGRPSSAGGSGWKVQASGSYLLPGSKDSMTWRIGDHGFEMGLSRNIPQLLHSRLAEWIDEWLARFELDRRAIGSWAIHPGGPKILTAAEQALSLPPSSTEISRRILAEHGNMSSATLIMILERSIGARLPLPCVALGFGPGLTVESTLFQAV